MSCLRHLEAESGQCLAKLGLWPTVFSPCEGLCPPWGGVSDARQMQHPPTVPLLSALCDSHPQAPTQAAQGRETESAACIWSHPLSSVSPILSAFLQLFPHKKHWDPLSAHLTLRMPLYATQVHKLRRVPQLLDPDDLKLSMLGHRILHSQFALGLANNVVDAIRVFLTGKFCSQTCPPPRCQSLLFSKIPVSPGTRGDL